MATKPENSSFNELNVEKYGNLIKPNLNIEEVPIAIETIGSENYPDSDILSQILDILHTIILIMTVIILIMVLNFPISDSWSLNQ